MVTSRARSTLTCFVLCVAGAAGCAGRDTDLDHLSSLDGDGPVRPPPPPPVSAGWPPERCSAYSYTPDNCHGSAENPNCTSTFELRSDGEAVVGFDDIVESGSYEVSGDRVTVTVPGMDYTATYVAEDGGAYLVASRGQRYRRDDC